MSKKRTYQFITSYGFSNSSGVTFLLPGKEIIIEGANDVLPIILPLCNGYRTIEEVVSITTSKINYGREDIQQLIQVLLERQILIDAHHYYQLFQAVSANPIPFWQNLSDEKMARMLRLKSPFVPPPRVPQTPLEILLEARESVREFSGEALSEKEIIELGWVVYGKIGRSASFPESTIGLGTVPSGGALYPLRLFVIVLKKDASIEKGVYSLGFKGITKVAEIDTRLLEDIFGGYSTPINSVAAIFVLVCEFQRITQKYSNRGYRYALIEVGHAAQNAYLWCAEQKLGIVEVCGYNDEALAKALFIPYPDQAPLTTLFVGRRLV